MGVDRQGANKKQMKQRRCHFLAWTAAMDAVRRLRRLDPALADKLFNWIGPR
jgi:hypothetical protein